MNKKLETCNCKLKALYAHTCTHVLAWMPVPTQLHVSTCLQHTTASQLIPSNTTTEDHFAYYARVTGKTSEANTPTVPATP